MRGGHVETMAARHPAIRFDADVLDVDEGDVLTAAGFGTAAAMRHHLRIRLRTSPTAYRSAFVSSNR